MGRKDILLERITEAIQSLIKLQDINGCFFYPYHTGETDYCNARWQESILSMVWMYIRNKNKEMYTRIENGINFLISIQNQNGSFPEYSKKDSSFSATAFITFSLTMTFKLLQKDIKKEWKDMLENSLKWLSHENEIVYTNQEAAAGASLILGGLFLDNHSFTDAGLKKIHRVLDSKKVYYPENGGFDLGYSSLTLEYLGFVYETGYLKEKIKNSVESYYKFLEDNDLKDIKNSRNTKWIILDGFEIFADKIKDGETILNKILKLDVYIDHTEREENLCTDLYRLCFAYDHMTSLLNNKMELKTFNPEKYNGGSHKKILNPLRRFGLHRIRSIIRII
ncbi:MAG: hypothetical protein AABX19_00225 [Nanoarchaeota archaeon]